MSIKIEITHQCKQDLKEASFSLLSCLFNHYIEPIQAGKSIDELRGRFKPSWKIAGKASMQASFIKIAKENNLHHYHFGYEFYKPSVNKEYSEDVSDGILHLVVFLDKETNTTIHRLIKVCTKHKPFILPIERLLFNRR